VIPYSKFYRWFKDCLTDFKTQEGQDKLHRHDFEIYTNQGNKTILVPIFRPEHFGVHMAIDEKHINGQFYTVLSNAKTGKVALLCSTIKANELKLCLEKFGRKLKGVSYLTLDLSPTFQKVGNENFLNTVQIADKFHVIKNGIEAVQAVRIRLKQEELKLQREEQVLHQKNYRDSKDKKFIGPKLKLSKGFKPKRLINGETAPELLSRSRYLCAISSDKWNEYQTRRANLLFKEHPSLRQAYQSITDFREWYKAKPTDFEPFTNEKQLGNWIDNAENDPNNEIRNFRNLVINHEERILNYHKHGHKTNAIAESVNAKIKEATRQNKGSRDLDFFHYRIAIVI
jgi:transposase